MPSLPFVAVAAVVVGALVLALNAPAARAAQGFITCDSNGYRYNYCAADTQGRVVLIREVSTGNLCRQGRGWGYDDSGIWVDRGCRGEFSFGRRRGTAAAATAAATTTITPGVVPARSPARASATAIATAMPTRRAASGSPARCPPATFAAGNGLGL